MYFHLPAHLGGGQSSSSSSLWTHAHDPSVPPTCHPENICPICQMYMDHFDRASFISRSAELHKVEERKHQVEVELLKRELNAARDRVIALETAYDELQMSYEESLRDARNETGAQAHQEREEAAHHDANSYAAPPAGNDYDVDADGDEWEVYPSPWMGSTSSTNIPASVSYGGASADDATSRTHLTPRSLSPTSASTSSLDSTLESAREPETPALTNASCEDAFRYAELLEQCGYDVSSANAVWREWEAAKRERQSASEDSSGDSEEEDDPDSDWEWETYDYDAVEIESSVASSSVSSVSSTSYSSLEDVSISSSVRNMDLAGTIPDVHIEQHPSHPLPLSRDPSFPSPIFRDIQRGIKPAIYVDASSTGAGFCFCVPTHSTTTASPRTSMTCYWLAWKWVTGHPSIPLGVSGKIVMSWAELVALELGLHVVCAMGYGSNTSHTSNNTRMPTKLTIHSDNTGVVKALSPSHHIWTPKHGLNAVVQRILGTCRENGVQLDVPWVRSEENVADGPSKGKGVRACVGVDVVRAVGGGGVGGTREREREREWFDWIDAVPVPDHLEPFVRKPTGGVVELTRMRTGEGVELNGRVRIHLASHTNMF